MAQWRLELLDLAGEVIAWTPFEGSEAEVAKVEEILNDLWHVRPAEQRGIGTMLRRCLIPPVSEAAL